MPATTKNEEERIETPTEIFQRPREQCSLALRLAQRKWIAYNGGDSVRQSALQDVAQPAAQLADQSFAQPEPSRSPPR